MVSRTEENGCPEVNIDGAGLVRLRSPEWPFQLFESVCGALINLAPLITQALLHLAHPFPPALPSGLTFDAMD